MSVLRATSAGPGRESDLQPSSAGLKSAHFTGNQWIFSIAFGPLASRSDVQSNCHFLFFATFAR
jgi:hypothetical protein